VSARNMKHLRKSILPYRDALGAILPQRAKASRRVKFRQSISIPYNFPTKLLSEERITTIRFQPAGLSLTGQA
ncbi:hypothetical protein M5Y49_24715, partial [Escherichia coli]|nr:hypothetical protein [Escherichia coli]